VIYTKTDTTRVYGIAGDAGGLSFGKLGELLAIQPGQYALTYAIEPGTFNSPNLQSLIGVAQVTSQPDELGLLVLNQQGTIMTRKKLRQGKDVEFLKPARYGAIDFQKFNFLRA
jgi:hypothetical protein